MSNAEPPRTSRAAARVMRTRGPTRRSRADARGVVRGRVRNTTRTVSSSATKPSPNARAARATSSNCGPRRGTLWAAPSTTAARRTDGAATHLRCGSSPSPLTRARTVRAGSSGSRVRRAAPRTCGATTRSRTSRRTSSRRSSREALGAGHANAPRRFPRGATSATRVAAVAERRENITQAARRFEVSAGWMQRLLAKAGLHERGTQRGRRVSFEPAAVDRAMAALGRSPKVTAPPIEEPAPKPTAPPATDAPAVPYDGPCETCLAVVECTGGRVLQCGWCKKGHPPWQSGMAPTRPELESSAETPRRRRGRRG